MATNQYVKYSPAGGGSGSGVSSLNSLTGALNLVAGSGITVTPSGSNITIAATNTGTVTNVTASAPLASSGGATPNITITQSGTGTDGYLSSTDWNTFNNKQSAGSYITALTGDVTASGPGSSIASLTAITNSTITTLSALSLPYSQITGAPASITALTGDGTATGPGSVSLTLSTVNSNTGSFGSSTSIPNFTVNGKGLVTAAGSNVVIAPAGTLTGTTINSTVVTSSLTSLGVQSQALNLGSHQINAVTDPSSAQDAATKNYVDTVASQLQPIQAVYAGTTGSNISGTYLNGAAGVGATFTTTSTSTFTVDGTTPPLASRVLIKDQTSGFQNGVYSITQTATGVLPTIFTRSLDYDTASDMNAGNLVPVINGTINAQTSWLQTASITTVGSDSLVYIQWTANPGNYLLKTNNLSDVSSKSTSFNNLSPMTTLGDIIYGGASGTGTRLPIGSSTQVLTVSGGIPAWSPAATTGANTALSNLSIVAINTTLLPGVTASIDLGSPTFTFRNEFIDGYTNYTQISTPATPAASTNSIYFKSDGNLYTINSSGMEQILIAPGISGTNWNNNLIFTPSSSAFGTITNGSYWSRRVGDSLEVIGSFTSGTLGSGNVMIQLPAGYTIDTTKLPSTTNGTVLGELDAASATSSDTWANGNDQLLFFDGSTNNQLFGASNTVSSAFNKRAANSAYSGALGTVVFRATIPIATWTVNNGSANTGFVNPMTSIGDLIVGGTAGAATRLPIGTNTYVLTSNGTTAGWSASGAGSSVSTAVFQEQYSSGTNGQTSTSGSWQQRVLNTTVVGQSWASLSSNQITLAAGTYFFTAGGATYNADRTQMRLYNITSSTTIALGIVDFYTSSGGACACLQGSFTLSGSTVIEIDQQVANNGLYGLAASFGTEVYCTITITKTA